MFHNFVADINNHHWKLVCLISTEPCLLTSGKPDWSGQAFMRHEHSSCTHWWGQSRKSKYAQKYGGNILQRQADQWDVCVYVNISNAIDFAIRDSLLSACGGQNKVYCADHQFPLIAVAQKGHAQCNCLPGSIPEPQVATVSLPTTCGKQAAFSCAVPSCYNGICNVHHKAVIDTDNKFYVGDRCYYGRPRTQSEADVNENLRGINFLHPEQGYQDGSWSDDSDADSIESNNFITVMKHCADPNYFTAAKQGLDDIDDNSSIDDNEGSDLPCTNAGAEPLFSDITGTTYASNSIGNHVLLNHYGHMLIRRKSSLTGTMKQRHFLQRLIACYPGKSIPLVYPEAMLFPDIFYAETNECDLIGAIPACFLNDNRWLHANGFDSLEAHFRNRLSHPGLLTSSNPKYHFFAFDALSNLGLRGCDSRIILRRGFAEMQGEGGVRFRDSKEVLFDTEQVDSRPMVNKLAAATAEDPPTYFYTHTCSMKTHFGIKVIWDWLNSEELLSTVATGNESENELEHLKSTVIDSAGVLILRVWMEMIHIWIHYIVNSPERPMGPIRKYCARMELQDGDSPLFRPRANLPHLHSLFWTSDDLTTEAGLAIALDRIRGFILDIMRPEEREQYIQDGVLPDNDDVVRFCEMAQSMLTHRHNRRCMVVTKDNDTHLESLKMKCKANDNFAMNPSPGEHTFLPIPIEHTEAAIAVLQSVGLGTTNDSGEFIPLHKCLESKKHYPPSHGNEGIIQPVIGPLFVRNPNMSNVQHPTGYTLNRYLTKYILSIDTYNSITIRPSPRDQQGLQIEAEELPNQKITANRIKRQKQETEDHKERLEKSKKGRAFNVTEFYMMLFGYAPIMTNIKFIKITSTPYNERSARERRRKPITALQNHSSLQGQALTAINCIPNHKVRSRSSKLAPFPCWRQFTPTQIQVLEDDLESPLTLNPVTRFGIRPPELRFVMQQKLYFQWFHATSTVNDIKKQYEYCEKHLHAHDLQKSRWIDGQMNHVCIRKLAITKILVYINSCPPSDFGDESAKQATKEHFQALGDAINARLPSIHQKNLISNFICEEDAEELPTIWMDNVRPTRADHFLIHILLSMGSFTDEYSLFCHSSLKECFVHARLLDPLAPEYSAKLLTKQYITEQLSTLPAGTHTFDRFVVAANNCFRTLFESDLLFSDDVPTVLYSHLQEETTASMDKHLKDIRTNLANSLIQKLCEAGVPNLPSPEECIEATIAFPCPWDIDDIPRSQNQPEESFQEQQEVRQISKALVQHYLSSSTTCTKNLCIAGGPGVGKTTTLFCNLLYSMCQGLFVMLTALLAERAQELGGIHIHDIFGFPVNELLSPGQLAERAIAYLYRHPEKMHLVRRMDILSIDEMGLIPSELLSAMCIVLRYTRGSERPFGGVHLPCSLDYKQIDPITGSHPLLSPVLCSSFLFRMLKHSVRAALDARFRRIQDITRMSPSELQEEGIRDEFVTLLVQTCTFVRSLSDPKIPDDILFAFGKHAPIKAQEKRILKRIIDRPGSQYVISTAQDRERGISGNFQPASVVTSKCLDKQTKEPKELILFKHGRYQLTYNKSGEFSTSQLAILFDLPEPDHVQQKKPIKLLIAPPGCRLIPGETATKSTLMEQGWMERFIAMPKGRSDTHNVQGSMRAVRLQYGLRHHIGATIHAVMGQTLSSILTRVEAGGKSEPYSLWLASQIVVLLSRTRLGKHTFIWCPEPKGASDSKAAQVVANTIFDLLQKTSPFRNHLTNLVNAYCNQSLGDEYVVDQSTSIYRVKDQLLPTDCLGYVYLLVSLKDLSVTYIGSTKNIAMRFNRHNSGIASQQTNDARYKPWGLLAYITGFGGDHQQYNNLENEWIAATNRQHRNRRTLLTVQGIVSLGKELVADYNKNHPTQELRFVDCGTISRQQALNAQTGASA
jgi:hypothetical protein